MKRTRRLAAFFLAGLLLAMPAFLSPTRAQAANTPIRPVEVALATGLAVVHLSADGPYTLVNQATGAVVISGRTGQVAEVKPNAQGLAVAGVGTFTGPLRLQPAPDGAGNPGIGRWESKRYRGVLVVSRDASGQLTVVNEVNLEDYLLGVVPAEMPAAFPPEALKAQAVASRTYVYYQMIHGAYAQQGYDVMANTSSQVYNGAVAEDPRTTAAVQATRGTFVLYNGQPIDAFFFASGGGFTENSENVFSSPVPYLTGVVDYDQESPKFSWDVTLTLTAMQQALATKGMDVGTLYNIVPAGPQGVSGRWTTLALVGSQGQSVVKAGNLRLALGLNSTLFQMVPHGGGIQPVQSPLSPDQTVQVLGRDGATVSLALGQAVVRGAGGQQAPLQGQPATVVAEQQAPASLEFIGHGWGHGVGLSQWGASGMAKQGNTFDAILRHYYQQTTVGPLPAPAGTN